MAAFRTLSRLGGLLLVSCSSAQAANEACVLVFSTRVAPQGRWQYAVQVSAENVSDRDVAFVLPDRCPEGPIAIEGLPDGYDYYQSCIAGACAGGAVQTVQLAPRQKRAIARLVLAAAGGACNPPLDPGLYQLKPIAPPLAMRMCVEPARLDLRQMKLKPKPPQPVQPPPALTPLPEPASDPQACTRSDECTIACPSVRGCCGWPCGCTNAVRRDGVDTFAREYARTCTRAPNCPIVACAYEPATSAQCIAGRCEAVRGLDYY